MAVTADANGVWALAGAPLRLWHRGFNLGAPTTSEALPAGAVALGRVGGYLWVLFQGGRLIRLDAHGAGPVVTLDLGRPATAMSVTGDRILVTVS